MFWASKPAISVALGLMATAASADCRVEIAERDFTSKSEFQRGFFIAAVQAMPEVTELARINRDLQVALANSRRLKLIHLIETAPDRLTLDGGISAFSNFNWSSEDDAALRAENADYVALEAEIQSLNQANQRHPDWPILRAWARENPDGRAQVTALTEAFRANRAEISAALAACH